ncbi:cytochrome b5 reductase 4 [Rhodotorula toruloides]|uniref:Cytochrome b5 reductase 4 n=1 Tax=Rhodotorula toruloides TaxID=5286 RepID=A0A511KHT4_RHOTO|nr:cytochrome b5 reductase 4 [Rhodotorula toruloides]
MLNTITHAFGWRASGALPSIVAEADTTSVAFPAVNSHQRAKAAPSDPSSSPAPSFSLSPPGSLPSVSSDDRPDDAYTNSEDEETALPSIRVDGSGAASAGSTLAPPTTTKKVVKAPRGRGGVTTLLRVTPSELAKHNTREDCWQVYNGKVYNVGPFLRYHPGGAGEMMRAAGKDVLAHAWVNYETLLENCLVGFLVPE